MTEGRTTAAFCALALTLMVVTWAMAPRVNSSGTMVERGETLFPQFRDPNAAASLEIVKFNCRRT